LAGRVGAHPGVVLQEVAGNRHYVFCMTTSTDPVTDNHVRQALKYGINREEMVEKILFGCGVVGNDHPIGPNQRFFNADLAQKSYDPDQALWRLEQAGLNGVAVDLHVADAAFTGAVNAGSLFAESAKAAGIDLTAVREPNDGYWSDVWMKKPFSASLWSGRPTADQMFSSAYAAGAPWNETFWSNDRFNALLIGARAVLDEAVRAEMYAEMQGLCANHGGAIIPMFASFVFAHAPNVAHDELASNWDMDGEKWAERWWLA
jgi:peptide/nickel transport system substrate-binding protein